LCKLEWKAVNLIEKKLPLSAKKETDGSSRAY